MHEKGEIMKILVGMSGGVDSTYAALKLIDEGHSVEGAVLVMHEYTETDAAEIAAKEIGIRLHSVDCKGAFDNEVKAYFVNEYLHGRTPNPCIVCNRAVKFKCLIDFARANGFDAVATGHYAKIVKITGAMGERYTVKMAEDKKKDQSYMLARLSQEELSMLLLPLSDLTKDDIRKRAQKVGISSSAKRDSQEICFIPDNDYASYVEGVGGKCPKGDFIDAEGNKLGEHNGIVRYTVGQRKGLGISLGARAFVSAISAKNNTVTLLPTPPMTSRVEIDDIIFSGIEEPEFGSEVRVSVKLRYAAPPVSATVRFIGGGRAQILLDEGAKAVTPGQAAVAYINEKVAFCGFICSQEA